MPGSMLTYTIDKSLKKGARSGLLISLGHVLLELLLVILVLVGIGRYLKTDTAQIIIGIAGGCVLIYFGYLMVKDVYYNRIKLDFEDEKADSKYGNLLLGGALISAANPYFIFWWAVVGLGLIMEAYNKLGIIGVGLFYIGHIISDLSWYGLVSLIVSKTRHLISLKVYRGIIIFLAICLGGFGFSFLYSSILKIVT